MFRSEEFFQLDQALREAGEVGQTLRLSLLRHFGELIRDLASNLDADASLQPPDTFDSDGECAAEATLDEAESPVQARGPIALSAYGDEAALHAVRMEALRVFETRSLSSEAVVVLWIDVVQLWGRPLVLCMGATVEGYRRVLGFVEASLQEITAVQQLFEDLLDHGLCVEWGLLCVTTGAAALSQMLTACLGPQVRLQYCQMHKRARPQLSVGGRPPAPLNFRSLDRPVQP